MVLVTVVGELQCKKGYEFVFGGPIAECRDCKVKNVCFHLEQDKRYRVVEIRDGHHEEVGGRRLCVDCRRNSLREDRMSEFWALQTFGRVRRLTVQDCIR